MRHAFFAIPFLFAAAATSAPLNAEPGAAAATSLVVTVPGLRSTKGMLIACLWREKQGFPNCDKSRTARRLTLPVSGSTMQARFTGLAPGSYAVTVHHDEDGNGRLKRNLIGMPSEGVGASNNPGGMPGFAKSLIRVSGDSATTVRMRYLFG